MSLRKNNLIKTGYLLALVTAKDFPGEAFHKDYKKNRDVFRRIISADRKLERGMRKYFKDLTQRLDDYIDWIEYSSQARKASVSDFIVADWNEEQLILRVILTDALKDAIVAGGMLTQLETNIDIGFGAGDSKALEFIRKHSLELAKGLNNTTKDRVRAGLALSLQNGESQAGAVKRLIEVIDDPARAATIAHTEAVNAFSAGRLEVGLQIGADRKEWSVTAGACPICEPLEGEIVGIEEDFSSGDDSPPAHPNCRCLVRILMPEE